MTSSLVVLGALALGVFALKAAGPLLLGSRPLPERLAAIAHILPAALLAALVVTSGVAAGRALAVDARVAGIAVAALALWRRAPFVVAVLAAVATTATVRLLAG